MLEQIYGFMVAAHKKDRDDFVAAHPECVFVVDAFNRHAESKFRTTSGAVGLGTHTSIARIRKREGANAFAMMVTVGRAKNNDIELPAADVSKFHAYLMEAGAGAWAITDAGSSYGTKVAGARLRPKEDRVALAPGDVVELGSVRATFHTPESLYEFLTSTDAS